MLFDKMQGDALRYSITAVCGSGFLLFGYDQGVFGGLLSNKLFLSTFDDPSPTIQGQFVATYDIGCIAGTVASMLWGDRLGRRRCILIGCVVLVVGAVLQTAAYSLAQMIVGRVVAGVGNGVNTIAIPVWQSETAEARHRGKLIVLQLVTNIFGIVITNAMSVFAVVFIFVYYVSYGLSLLSIPYMFPAENNSQRMRNIGTSIATAVNWTFVYVVVVVTPTAINGIGWKYYLVYAVLNFCFVPVIWRWYVETADLSLEQVDRLFEIKYEGGKDTSWKQATRLARMETPEVVEEKMRATEHAKFVQAGEKK
ncbi:hypothetical protein SLS58_003254 [Diplodia intermedia]|uniref:Major facilitator superfamily (MFS) profile domain-containing protein n=1 Tax=Diplodia intermedia TaxID=856260 RepID=A0ABR3TX98_9PEZI